MSFFDPFMAPQYHGDSSSGAGAPPAPVVVAAVEGGARYQKVRMKRVWLTHELLVLLKNMLESE